MAASDSEGVRARSRIAWLARCGLDLPAFWNEAAAALEPAIAYHLTPCWFTLDPASLLVTSHYDHGMIPELPADWLAHEYYEDDFHRLTDVARSQRPVSTLHEATGGDPSLSRRWSAFIAPFGGEQELLLALRTRGGDAWGVLALYRHAGQPKFSEDDAAFLTGLSPFLAEGARRGLLVGEAADPDRPDPPGVVIVRADWTVESATPAAERWLGELAEPRGQGRLLPPSVLAVAGRVLGNSDGSKSDGETVARVPTRRGRWLILHGATLSDSHGSKAAIIIEPAEPARISAVLMAAYGLSAREQDVARLVLSGLSTEQIAAALFLSPHTVQQHLKSVFDKTGVRSRRELTGNVFFSHYEPRLRDNETRAVDARPLRGGPLSR